MLDEGKGPSPARPSRFSPNKVHRLEPKQTNGTSFANEEESICWYFALTPPGGINLSSLSEDMILREGAGLLSGVFSKVVSTIR